VGEHAHAATTLAAACMNLPEDLRYSREHEWVRVDGGTARVGITDFAQDSLGDVVFVQLPAEGLEVTAGASVSEIESTKSVSDVYVPVSGVIRAVNHALDDQPELVNRDPYGDGWMFEVELADPGEVDRLLDAAAYRGLLEEG
jgi:glycine cleavage system H protein